MTAVRTWTSQRGPRGALSPVRVTIFGLVVDVILGAVKTFMGLTCNSQTIFADGLHSAGDAATDLAVLTGLRVTARAADAEHPYGHRRAMTLMTALIALVVLGTAAFIAYRAIRSFNQPAEAIRPAWPLVAALASVALKETLYQVTAWSGRRAGDTSLIANAWHHRSDAMSSVAAAGGLIGVILGGPAWRFLDHLTALVLACFLAVMAWRLIRDALAELMDQAPSKAVLERIRRRVTSTPGVHSFHAFRARRIGGKVEMDIHVQVDPTLTVREGHDIATEVRRRIVEANPDVLSVIVHVEPAEG